MKKQHSSVQLANAGSGMPHILFPLDHHQVGIIFTHDGHQVGTKCQAFIEYAGPKSDWMRPFWENICMVCQHYVTEKRTGKVLDMLTHQRSESESESKSEKTCKCLKLKVKTWNKQMKVKIQPQSAISKPRVRDACQFVPTLILVTNAWIFFISFSLENYVSLCVISLSYAWLVQKFDIIMLLYWWGH